MIYVISDIHGEYEKFSQMLELISLSDSDTLYILGDVLDRGNKPVTTLMKIMNMPNVISIIGNHELMALECLKFITSEITDYAVNKLDDVMLEKMMIWSHNGGNTTLDEFKKLSKTQQQNVLEYIKDSLAYKQLEVGGKKFLLVHGGLKNFAPDRSIDSYKLYELVWDRPDYEKVYFDDVFLVTGHTPTTRIKNFDNPGHIYNKNNHIAIDCGACIGGNLGCICLDTLEEYYVE